MNPEPGLQTRETLAKFLAIQPSTVDHLRRTGQIQSLKVGRTHRFEWAAIYAYLDAIRSRKAPPAMALSLHNLRPVPTTRRRAS